MKNMIENHNGQAMIEFIIVYPVLMLMIASIMQLSLFYTAKQILNYAADYAVRTAIVWIPEDVYPEIKNDKIKQAVSIILSMITPGLDMRNERLTGDLLSNGLNIINSKTNRNDLIQRYETADKLITVSLFDSEGIPFPMYTPFNEEKVHTDITVELRYHCPLILPFMDIVLSPVLDKITLNNQTIYALPMKSTSTLPLEGNVQNKG